jgi:hypothetical protein
MERKPVTVHELAQAKDPDLRGSLQAIKRAAAEARRIAIQTGTGIVIVRDHKLVHLSAAELQRIQAEQPQG